ncbi:fatty aldehyde dehydrogenase [Lasallia pustulata]|uniref:Aldehyde dehydrogenase n=1 Tax=Lasallia pustulata TaxID=136370 RepID=A0A1W5DE22_9LECA|nr:fatty aldehyde dehydrogenase [Lasallia pustulata]
MASQVPEFKHTEVGAIPSVVNQVRSAFNAQKTKPVEFRLVQLRKLYWGLKDNEAALLEACKHDIGKGTFETMLTEISWCENDIVFVCNNLAKWAKDEKAPDMPLTNSLFSPTIRKDPLGCVLVIGAYNFPVNLTIGPLVGAIAAGNTAIVKPSESAPATAAVLQRIIENYLDPSCYGVVQGAIPETTALLDQKWDMIFYTGGAVVGKIIAKKAAETLTPVTLELGGRNPAIVTKNADVRLAARRLLWGKFLNAGQVCLSQNYILVDKEVLPGFLAELRKAMQEFYPDGAKASPDYGRIINERQWRRLKNMIDESKGKILMGGTMDEADKFMEPTVIQVDDLNDSLIKDESFGPLIPILPVEDLDQAIRIANEVQATPLALYPFGSKKETNRVLNEVRSGGASVNDSFFHASIPTLAFGGVGESGQGAYRGKASFDCFTHRRSVTTTPGWLEGMISIRYPPYKGKWDKAKKMNELKPNFDREGKVKTSVFKYLLTLGAGSFTWGFSRFVLILLAALGVRQYLERRARL